MLPSNANPGRVPRAGISAQARRRMQRSEARRERVSARGAPGAWSEESGQGEGGAAEDVGDVEGD